MAERNCGCGLLRNVEMICGWKEQGDEMLTTLTGARKRTEVRMMDIWRKENFREGELANAI